MAGDWIKWTCGLPDKPEVIRMAARLKVAREIVVCRLLKFWEWCDANIPDDAIQDSGSAFVDLSPERGDNVAFVDALVGTPGFADSLAAVDWIRFRDGRVELPNFGRHNGETAKTRARNAKNQKRKRQRGADEPPPKEVNRDPPESPKKSPLSGDKTMTRGEERRDRKKKPTASSSGEPDDHPHKLLFGAVAEVCGVVPDSERPRKLIGMVASELLAADPPYTPAEVRDFGARFAVLCSWAANSDPPRARPTPNELAKWIHKVRATADPIAPPKARTKAERDAEYFGRQAAQAHAAMNSETQTGDDW
jgi:hypothetical protein